MEAHIINRSSESDFYGVMMKLCVVGFIRPEIKFDSLQTLRTRIEYDKSIAHQILTQQNLDIETATLISKAEQRAKELLEIKI